MEALIRHYLHSEPALDDYDDFIRQQKQALFLEERYFKNLVDILSKLFGSKK